MPHELAALFSIIRLCFHYDEGFRLLLLMTSLMLLLLHHYDGVILSLRCLILATIWPHLIL